MKNSLWLLLTAVSSASIPALAQTSDVPKTFVVPKAHYDYIRREIGIPMRDGVKLHTVIMMAKNTKNAPILLTRTPYNASKRTERTQSPTLLASLPQGDEVFVEDGYIRVFQDIRGKYKS
ncbi:MAG: glutaryl-7-ACA acylase, partial [Acidobacteriia bacterium]|nr:glutaryl-7-ACA acylase [Terriglobia bacterium]